MSRYPSPTEPTRSRSAPYPQFGWQGAVCQERQIFLQPAVTCGLNRQHFHTGPWLGRDWKKQKTKEQRCLNSSTNILSHLDKRHSRKTSIIAVQLLLQNTHSFSMHTHIQHPAVQPVSRARRGCIVVSSQTSTEFLMLEYQLWETKLSQAYFKPNLLFGIHVINYS